MSARPILVDGTPVGRIGYGVTHIEPLDDNRHAWILASTYRRSYEPSWGVLRWSLDDGHLTMLREGRGSGAGIAARGGRVFVGGSSREIGWEEVDGGASGAVAVQGSLTACSPDGRYLTTQRRGERRTTWYRIWSVAGDGEPFPEIQAPLVFSDDSRFAAHLGEDEVSLRWISLEERATASVEIGASKRGWRGVSAVRGAPRMIAWDAEQIVICDLAAQRIVGQVAVDSLEHVGDAAAQRILIGTVHGTDASIEALDLESGRRVRLAGKRAHALLTPDGRRALFNREPVLDVVDTTSGAVFSAHEGHRTPVRNLVWARDGAAVATSADDGRVRVLRTADPPVVTELEGERNGVLRLAFSPDGRRICAVTSSEITVADARTGAITARFPSFGIHVHSAEISADGRHLVAGSYGHGIRVVDLATGQHVMIERDATKDCGSLVLVEDDILALRTERLGRPEFFDPVELVHWIRLDLAGAIKARGTWRFEEAHQGIELCVDGVSAMVAWYPGARRLLRTYDLRAPDGPGHEVSIPAGEKLLDVRSGRALFGVLDDLVRRDPSTGAETWRIHCPRRPWNASLSHDGNAIAVAYRDQGVEVLAHAG